jgi:hypothetical protein
MITALASLIVVGAAPVPDKRKVAACIDASTRGQQSKLTARYGEAQRAFAACSASECPDAIRADCAKGLAEVDALIPSVVFAVRDERGLDVNDATLLLDDAEVRLDGKPLPLEVGPHQLSLKRGSVAVNQTLIVTAGEKGRVVSLTLPREEVATAPRDELPKTSPSAPAASGPRIGAFILLGIAGVGAAAFTGFGLAGRGAYTKLSQQPCASTKTCMESEQAPIRSQFLVADASLAVALTAGIGALVWLLWPQ